MNIAVIGSYPEQGTIHSPSIVGGASYTKQLVQSMRTEAPDMTITVFGEQLTTETTDYVEQGVSVKRIWKRNSVASITKLVRELLVLNPDRILFSFEAYMFGSMGVTTYALLLLLWLKVAKGVKIITIVHQVVIAKIIPLSILSSVAYSLLSWLSTRMVVFEQDLVTGLKQKTGRMPVQWIPHAIPMVTPMGKAEARKKLGWHPTETYYLYFGFLAQYKGVDRLLDIWHSEEQSNHLIIVGGQNPNHRNNKNVTKFVTDVTNKAQSKGIAVTGVVPEEQVAWYFSAADGLILPYTQFISSSGPLSLACAYGLPFILSRPLHRYFDSSDLRDAFAQEGVDGGAILFDFTGQSVQHAIEYSMNHTAALRRVCHTIADMRSFKRVAKQFVTVINDA